MVIALAPERAQLGTVMDSLHFSVSRNVKKIARKNVGYRKYFTGAQVYTNLFYIV